MNMFNEEQTAALARLTVQYNEQAGTTLTPSEYENLVACNLLNEEVTRHEAELEKAAFETWKAAQV